MIIENIEALKTWLTTVLSPLCEADPAALAKYVIALVKKDKPESDLRSSCIEQLDVFLRHETKPFVELLFSTLNNEDYINNDDVVTSTVDTEVKEVVIEEPNNDEISPFDSSENSGVNAIGTILSENTIPPEEDKEPNDFEGSPEISEREAAQRDRRASLRSRSHRRSRSWDKVNSTSYREKGRGGSFRASSRERIERYDDRRKRALRRSDRRERKSRSRSPKHRSRSPKHRARSPKRRSRSPKHRSPKHRSRSPKSPTKGDRQSKSRSRSKSPTKTLLDGTIIDVSRPPPGYHPRARCQDFDEKGYCVRGDQCPYDHGNDPVILENISLPSQGPNPQYMPPGPLHSIRPPPFAPPPRQNMFMRPPMEPYDPNAPAMKPHGFGARWQPPYRHPLPYKHTAGTHYSPSYHQPRELINVQTVNNSDTENVEPKKVDNFRTNLKKYDNTNCTLELGKIPTGLNTITHLNSHFSKFGRIVNIQVCYDDDPEASLVTFSSNAEANVAYRSTEAVLNNRFIKVFWHSPNKHPTDSTNSSVVKDRAAPYKTNKVLNRTEPNNVSSSSSSLVKKESTEDNTGAVQDKKAQTVAEIQRGQIMLSLKKKAEQKKKEYEKMMQGLRKKKQDLLERQISQQKLLISKLQAAKGSDKKVEQLKTAFRQLETLTAQLKNEISQSAKSVLVPDLSKVGALELKKLLLDAELDLHKKEQAGEETTELKQRVIQIKREVANRGNLMPPAAPRDPMKKGRGFVLSTQTNLDKRPKCLLVSGYELDEKKDMMNHFAQYGEIEDVVMDDNTPSVIVQYKSRKEAENAMNKGRHFRDRTLTMNWYSQRLPRSSVPWTQAQAMYKEPEVVEVEDDDDDPLDTINELLGEDEDEEEERSWRR